MSNLFINWLILRWNSLPGSETRLFGKHSAALLPDRCFNKIFLNSWYILTGSLGKLLTAVSCHCI